MRQKIKALLNVVKMIEKDSSEAANKSREAANEVSGGLTASYSAAGDAEHARNTADLSMGKVKQNQELLMELKEAIYLSVPKTVSLVCFVKVNFGEAGEKELYLVKNPVFISGFNLISPSSPIGEAIIGKNVDDLFLYKTGDQTVTGKILEIG